MQCGRYREAGDLDHGPKGVGWLCKDRQDCQTYQADTATAQAQAQRERELQREREHEQYHSPEAVAERAAQEQQHREQREAQERERKLTADPIAALELITDPGEFHDWLQDQGADKLNQLKAHLGVVTPHGSRLDVWVEAIEQAWREKRPELEGRFP